MSDKVDKQQGEGDREAAKRYNERTREFVDAGKVADAKAKAASQTEKEARQAKDKAGSRAKEHDPEEQRDYSRPA